MSAARSCAEDSATGQNFAFDAVLHDKETLGEMLSAIIAHEREEFDAASEIMEDLLIPSKKLNEIVLKSYIWADSLLGSR